MSLDRLAVDFQLSGEAVERRQAAGARREQAEQPDKELGSDSQGPNGSEIAAEDPLRVGAEVASALSIGALEGIGKSSPDDS